MGFCKRIADADGLTIRLMRERMQSGRDAARICAALSCGLFFGLVAPNARAQSGTTQWGPDAKPFSKAVLPVLIRNRIEKVVFGGEAPSDRREGEVRTIVGRIRLGPGNLWGLRVFGGGKRCDSAGNCPAWIFDLRTGAVLLNDVGDEFSFKPSTHMGHYDLETSTRPGDSGWTSSLFRFDGRRYVKVKTTRHMGLSD